MINGGLVWEASADFTKEYKSIFTKLQENYPICPSGDIRRVVYEMLAAEFALQAISVIDVSEERFEEIYSNRVFKCILDNVEKSDDPEKPNSMRDLKLQVLGFLKKVKYGNQQLEKYISFKIAPHTIVSGHMKIQSISNGEGKKHLVAIVINGLSKATEILKQYKNYPFSHECKHSFVDEKEWIRVISNLRIVQAEFLPALSSVSFLFPNSFVLNKTRDDLRCGSFVWHYQGPRHKFLMVAECSGFLKFGLGWKTIMHAELQRAYFLQEFHDPAAVIRNITKNLEEFHSYIFEEKIDSSKFAMVLLIEDTETRQLSMAGLNNLLYKVTKHAEITSIPKSKTSNQVYSEKILLGDRDRFYIIPAFDHEGYDENTRETLVELLRSTSALHLKDQEFILRRTLETLGINASKCVIGLGF